MIKNIIKLFRKAIGLELKTDVGKINLSLGIALIILYILILVPNVLFESVSPLFEKFLAVRFPALGQFTLIILISCLIVFFCICICFVKKVETGD